MERIFEIIERMAESEHVAMVMCMAVAVAFGYGWWRREEWHSARYDKLQEKLIDGAARSDEKIRGLAAQINEVLRELAVSINGIERTLSHVEGLVRVVLSSRLGKKTEH